MSSRPKPTEEAIREAARRYSVGSVVDGTTAEVHDFGVFVELPVVGVVGFIDRPSMSDVPAVGTAIQVTVVAHELERRQLRLRRT